MRQVKIQKKSKIDPPYSIVESAAVAERPSLDSLSYELYKVILPLFGPHILSALNHMLATDSLTPSLCCSIVCLIPKVGGVPTAFQLHPSTLLNTDCKLLTKMPVNRFLPVLPNFLTATQLCSVKGRTIFDGTAAALSTASFLHQHQLHGYLVSLDFFNAYDRVCLQWVDLVLEAMGFGPVLHHWVATLHGGATTTLMLHSLSPEVATTFSLRQGDPFALLLFIIQEEQFLCRLQSLLHGLHFAGLREASRAYMDDVSSLSSKLSDLP